MRSRMLKFLAALGLSLGLASTAAAQNYEGWLLGATSMRNQSDSEWKVNLGAGLGFGPGFIGGSQGKAHFLPIVDIEWRKSIFASTQRGIGMNLFGNRQTVAGPRLTFDWGRSPTDDTALANTAKVKALIRVEHNCLLSTTSRHQLAHQSISLSFYPRLFQNVTQ